MAPPSGGLVDDNSFSEPKAGELVGLGEVVEAVSRFADWRAYPKWPA